MSYNYAQLTTTATRLLTKFGEDTTITRLGGATFDPSLGSFSGGTTTTLAGQGVRLNYSSSEVDGEIIRRDDARLYFSGDVGTPETDDDCLFDAEHYRVMNVRALSPEGTDIMYELQLRR